MVRVAHFLNTWYSSLLLPTYQFHNTAEEYFSAVSLFSLAFYAIYLLFWEENLKYHRCKINLGLRRNRNKQEHNYNI